jgi:hypothetical protein
VYFAVKPATLPTPAVGFQLPRYFAIVLFAADVLDSCGRALVEGTDEPLLAWLDAAMLDATEEAATDDELLAADEEAFELDTLLAATLDIALDEALLVAGS